MGLIHNRALPADADEDVGHLLPAVLHHEQDRPRRCPVAAFSRLSVVAPHSLYDLIVPREGEPA